MIGTQQIELPESNAAEGVQQPNDAIRILELRAADGPGGGPDKTILYSAALSDPCRFDITVGYLRNRNDSCTELRKRAEGLGVRYHEFKLRGWWDNSALSQIQEVVRRQGIQLVHAHEYKSNLLALLLAKRQNIPCISTSHGWTGHTLREKLLYYPVDRFLLRYFPRVISVSSEITRHLIGRGVPADRIVTVSNAIDPDRFRPSNDDRTQIRSSMGIDDDDFVIGTVGRLEPQKRFDNLIEAFTRFLSTSPKSVLLIAGEGSLRKRLEAQISRLDLGQRCRLLGHVSDVRRLYECMDLFVQSSDYEGTPNVVLEAMAMEVPVIATDAGGTRDVLTDGKEGLIIPCRDLTAMVDAMSHARRNEADTRKWVDSARDKVENRLSFRARNRSIEELYSQLLKEFTFQQ